VEPLRDSVGQADMPAPAPERGIGRRHWLLGLGNLRVIESLIKDMGNKVLQDEFAGGAGNLIFMGVD